MNDLDKTDVIDDLVAGYLEAGAEGINGGRLLDRARRSTHMKRVRRRISIITAIAAALLVSVVGFMLTRAPQTDHPEITAVPLVAQTLQKHAEQAGSGAQTVLMGLDESVGRATGEILQTVPTRGALDFSSTFSKTRKSLEADARYVKTKAGNIVTDSLRKAGLVI